MTQPLSQKKISALFNKFAGREIAVTETTHTREFEHLGKQTWTDEEFTNPNDPLLAEIGQVAADNGLALRVWLPRTMGTMDYRTDRLNVYINKEADGKYRIKNFGIG